MLGCWKKNQCSERGRLQKTGDFGTQIFNVLVANDTIEKKKPGTPMSSKKKTGDSYDIENWKPGSPTTSKIGNREVTRHRKLETGESYDIENWKPGNLMTSKIGNRGIH